MRNLPARLNHSFLPIADRRFARLEERAMADVYLAELKDEVDVAITKSRLAAQEDVYQHGLSSCLRFYDKALERAGTSQGKLRLAADFTSELTNLQLTTIHQGLA